MNNSLQQTLALSAIFQAASLVKTLSWHGKLPADLFAASIHSIFQLEAPSIFDIYDAKKLKLGVQTLKHVVTQQANKDRDIMRYVISLTHLERSLIKNNAMIQTIQQGVERAQSQARLFSPTHENVIANLADIYSNTLSTFKFRIQVTGEPAILTNAHIVNQVRVLLLSGIRATVLWRQLGGSRWKFLFGKKQILANTTTLLNRYIDVPEHEPV